MLNKTKRYVVFQKLKMKISLKNTTTLKFSSINLKKIDYN